jgi:hypothetical protein
MTKLERHFRKLTLAERIRQLESEVMVLGEDSRDAPEYQRLRLVRIYLSNAAEELERALEEGGPDSDPGEVRLPQKAVVDVVGMALRKEADRELVPQSPEALRRRDAVRAFKRRMGGENE